MSQEKRETGALPAISNAEWEVMKVLWDDGPMAARDVFAALPSGHGWAYKTVKTLLSRLAAKGAISYEQIGNSYLYRAAYSRNQVTRREVRGFVRRVLDGSSFSLLTRFIEDQDLSSDEIAQLQHLLGEKEKKAASKPAKKGD